MTRQDAENFLNDTPYYYYCIGMGVELRFKIGEDKSIVVSVKRNKEIGGMDVSCSGDVFHFVWDQKEQKWGLPMPQMASAS